MSWISDFREITKAYAVSKKWLVSLANGDKELVEAGAIDGDQAGALIAKRVTYGGVFAGYVETPFKVWAPGSWESVEQVKE